MTGVMTEEPSAPFSSRRGRRRHVLHRLLARKPSLCGGAPRGGPALAHVQSVAHRGGRARTTENSLAAMRHAVKHGMHMVEFDVHLTKDKRVVVFHDGDLRRMTGVEGHVNDFAYSDLPRLKLPDEIRADAAAGGEAGKDTDADAETDAPNPRQSIPLLSEILSALPPSTCMIVEVKAHRTDASATRELVQRTDALLKSHPMGHDAAGRVMWFSLQAHANNVLLPECNLDRPRITSARNATLFTLAHWSGVLPFLPNSWISGGAVCCGIVNPSSITVGLLRRVPGLACAPAWFLDRLRPWLMPVLASASMVAHLRARGMAVYMLGVNDASGLAMARQCGVDAVLTDRPRWLAESTDVTAALESRGKEKTK